MDSAALEAALVFQLQLHSHAVRQGPLAPSDLGAALADHGVADPVRADKLVRLELWAALSMCFPQRADDRVIVVECVGSDGVHAAVDDSCRAAAHAG